MKKEKKIQLSFFEKSFDGDKMATVLVNVAISVFTLIFLFLAIVLGNIVADLSSNGRSVCQNNICYHDAQLIFQIPFAFFWILFILIALAPSLLVLYSDVNALALVLIFSFVIALMLHSHVLFLIIKSQYLQKKKLHT